MGLRRINALPANKISNGRLKKASYGPKGMCVPLIFAVCCFFFVAFSMPIPVITPAHRQQKNRVDFFILIILLNQNNNELSQSLYPVHPLSSYYH